MKPVFKQVGDLCAYTRVAFFSQTGWIGRMWINHFKYQSKERAGFSFFGLRFCLSTLSVRIAMQVASFEKPVG